MPDDKENFGACACALPATSGRDTQFLISVSK